MNEMTRFLDAQYRTRSQARAFRAEQYISGECDFATWRRALCGALKEAVHLPDVRADIDVRTQAEEQLRGYTRLRLTYLAEPGLTTPAYLLVPRGADARTPVIVCLHGHGYGCKDAVGLLTAESYQKRFALSVSRAGMIALAPELAGFGALRLPEEIAAGDERQSSCHRLSVNLLACGRTLLGVRVNQAMRALDAARALYPGCKLGMMGISGGGTVTALTSVLDERVAACVISGYANTFESSILAMRHCVDNYWPDMAGLAEMPDLLAAIAPRPMLWETGSQDRIYPQTAALKAAQTVRACYQRLGAALAFEVDAFEGGHEISGARAFDFLRTELVERN